MAIGAHGVTDLQQNACWRAGPLPDTSGPGIAEGRNYPVTRGNVNTIRTPPATFSAATVPPILAM
jgi:hypothetical protein